MLQAKDLKTQLAFEIKKAKDYFNQVAPYSYTQSSDKVYEVLKSVNKGDIVYFISLESLNIDCLSGKAVVDLKFGRIIADHIEEYDVTKWISVRQEEQSDFDAVTLKPNVDLYSGYPSLFTQRFDNVFDMLEKFEVLVINHATFVFSEILNK